MIEGVSIETVASLRIGLDFRPALLSTAGIARSVRETVRALGQSSATAGLRFLLYGHSVAAARVPPPPLGANTSLLRVPFPSRGIPYAARWPRAMGMLTGRPDIFHFTDFVYPPIHARALIVTLHDLAFAENPAFHGKEAGVIAAKTRNAVNRADLVFVPTRATAEAAMDHLRVHAGKLRVIPWGADHALRIGSDLEGAKRILARHGVRGPYLLMPGTVEPRKNHARVLRVLPGTPAKDMTLVVTGKHGWEVDDVIPLLARPGVVWIKDLPDRTLFGLMAQAHAVVYPSLLEGFGFPPLEAMALGIPCLAGKTPALRETCSDAALLVDPKDDASVAAGITRIVEDSELRRKLSRAGPARAATFRWEETARLHAVAYREAIR
jgi:glycosyltransferase involved in cell wall biosynthesis